MDAGLVGASSSSPGELYDINTATGAATSTLVLSHALSFSGIGCLNGEMYATDVFDPNTGTFWFGRINTTTGVVTLLTDQDGSFNWWGLATNEAGGFFYTVDRDAGNLLKQVFTDGTTITIGATGVADIGTGLAYDNTTGTLWATGFDGNLYTLNTGSGAATLVGPMGLGAFANVHQGLTHDDASGTLYFNEADTFDSLYRVDKVTGTAFLIGSNGATAGAGIDALTFKPDGPPPPPACDKVLYGAATGQPGGVAPSDLYILDPVTGAPTLIGPIGFDSVTGLAFAPDGTLYGTANGDALYGDGDQHAILIRINTVTGAGTFVGEISNTSSGGVGRMPDISYAPDGTLYGYGDFGAGEGLWRIDPFAAEPLGTFVGPTGFFGGGNGLAFENDGDLIATPFDDQCLVKVDPVTGAGACIPGSEGNVPFRVNALAVCMDNGVLYGSWNDNGSYSIIAIEEDTGIVVGQAPTVTGLDAIAFECPPDDDKVLWGITSDFPTQVYRINASTGAATLVQTMNGDGSLVGASWLNDSLFGSDIFNYPGEMGSPFDVARFNIGGGTLGFLNDQAGSANWHGLASNESADVLYAIDINAGNVLQVSDLFGNVVSVGAGTGIDGRGMAYDDANGILYATNTADMSLYRVDTALGTSALIGPFGLDPTFVHGLAYNEDTGSLFLNIGGVGGGLYRVDKVTGAASFIGPNGADNIDGLAWRPAPLPCPWDLDGDGNIGFGDLLAVLSNWGPCAGCAPDFDGDGIVGFADLLKVLSNWGPCP